MLTSPTLSWSGLISWARRIYRSGSRAGSAAFKSSAASSNDSGRVDWQRGPDGVTTITALRSISSLQLLRPSAEPESWPSLSAYDGEDAFAQQIRYTLMLETFYRSMRPLSKATLENS